MTSTCNYPDRDEALVAFMYDDIEPSERVAFEVHISTCRACRLDLAQFENVRSQLTQWSPPQPDGLPSSQASRETGPPRATWWRDIPAWAQVAAALLFVGVAAGIANLDVRYDRSGLVVRTGWSRPSARSATSIQAEVPSSRATTIDASGTAPWRADLTALEKQLRTEFGSGGALPTTARRVADPGASNDAEVLRRVRTLLDESERRQQSELALRMAEVVRDVNAQRQADLVKIDRNLGFIRSNTAGEAMKQRQLLSYLVRASQKQ